MSAAQAAEGWYFGLAGGANWLVDADYDVVTTTLVYAGRNEYDTGFAVVSAVGYDYGRWRAEFEVGYRQNALDCVTTSTGAGSCLTGINGDIWELSQMVNVLYDIPLGGRMTASIGVGVGGVLVVADPQAIGTGFTSLPDFDDYVVAGQLIAGFSYDLTDRLQLFADYRYFVADDPEFDFVISGSGPAVATFEKSDHTALLGLRFDLQREAAPPPPPPPPPAPPPPPVKAPKQFIVFFGFNKSNLTPEAARVVADAAAAAKEFGSASISIVGHTDSSGSNSYNQALSMKRAQTVKDGLGAEGIPSSMVSTAGRGESELMVQTGDGVKEPQNRRATIDLN
jgi:outer membrane protein OmpA-like peptidoglycan-associated protein